MNVVKRCSLLFTILILSMGKPLQAQEGIRFEEGSFSTILKKAKDLKKPVFIDVYTSWCGPCKRMAKEIFPKKEVGEKFNASFINYALDAEKGEGVDLAMKYKVGSYPTYLFVNGDGVLLYRSLGSMPAEKFLTEASIALGEYADPKPFASWEDEYESRKNDKSFVWDYLQKRKKLKLSCADQLDQYFSLCSSDELFQSALLPDLTLYPNMNTDGPFYQFLVRNKDSIRLTIKEKYGKNVFFDQYLVFVAKNDIDRAIENRDEKLLLQVCTLLTSLPPDESPVDWRTGEVKMKYYTKTNNPKALLQVMKSYSKSVMQFDTRKIRIKDSLALDQYDKDLASGKIKAGKPEDLEYTRKAKGSVNITSHAYRIRDMAKAVFQVIPDTAFLKKALEWIRIAETYTDNFTIYETRASLYYKLGKKREAIALQEDCIERFTLQLKRMNISNDKIMQRLNDALQKMKDGLETWGLAG